MIVELLTNKTRKERCAIKSREIAKIDLRGEYTKDGLRIEIVNSTTAINGGQAGIEFFAKAWRGTKQLGFGKDGSVEIERFRIYNPPILVDDPAGDIIREWTNPITGESEQRRLKEDPTEAIKQSLAHTIVLVGKEDSQIIKGKIGNTTDTFYPSDDNSIYVQNAVWATVHGATTGTLRSDATYCFVYAALLGGGDYTIERAFVNWDTSSIPDTDTIDSAVVSLWGVSKLGAGTRSYNLYSSTATDTIVANDFDLVGTTAYCDTAINQAGWTTGAYNDYTLNATGLAAISKTGLTKISVREVVKDVGNVAPADENNITFSPVDDTAGDPKLVVVHTAPSTSGFFNLL